LGIAVDQMTITGTQAKTARLLLEWDQSKMSAEARLSRKTISDFENRKRGVSASAVAEIRYVLEKAGVEFTTGDEPRVKLRKAK
jgi:transcriptional regulator with XRE-family HTH domain